MNHRHLATAIAAIALVGGLSLVRPAEARDRAGRAGLQAATTGVVVHAGSVVRPINRDLVGIHGRDAASAITDGYPDLQPTTFRHVMSEHDFMSYDCATDRIAASSLTYFDDWLDAVYARGAEPILSLSYVPPCYARNGQPKGPASDVAGYRRYLDQLFASLITDRQAAGKTPLRRFELWNEPDIPLFPESHEYGHGYVGTEEDFVRWNLPSLAGAILQAEATSGVRIQVGTPASFAPWPNSRYGATLADMLVDVNGLDRAQAEKLAASADAAFGPGATDRILHNGGLTWPKAIIAAAPALGLHIDFVSVHLYPNNPLQTLSFPEPDQPTLLAGRNPYASPENFATLASEWRAAFPGKELVVSEWAISAGSDARFGTCEAASSDAATFSVMQDSAIDRALYLGRPPRMEIAPFQAWETLPPSQVQADLASDLHDVWTTAAADADRTTILLSQWHTELTDAVALHVPVTVDGLADGDYEVTVEWLGEHDQRSSGRRTSTATVTDGTLTLDQPVPLDGQSLARVDVRRAGVDPLPTLLSPGITAYQRTGGCLAPAKTTTTTTTSTTTTTTTPSTAPTPASPVDGAASYTG